MSVDLEHLAIFPLPGALLFPHAVLPLHIFELRYQRMIADALDGDRAIAIACVDGEMSEDPPHVRGLVGIGSIVAHEPLSGGRSNVLLRGLGRAHIEEELDEGKPYRLVRARWAKDLPISAEHELHARQTLTALASQLAERLPEGGDTLRALVQSQSDASGLADLLAAALVTKPAARLRIFEMLDVRSRADGVTEAIGVALASLTDRGGAAN